MNERIQKLWAQAAFELNQEFFSFPDNWDELLREKFAELIVRECMMLCGAVSGAAQVVRPNDAFGDGAEKCEALIKEHFGVK